jgi:hypothetical protein
MKRGNKTPLTSKYIESFCKLNTLTGCLEWQRSKDGFGYGMITNKRTVWRVHRLVWVMKKGPIFPNECILHKCDNPKCCNIEHLFIGTKTQNTEDMVSKDRHAKGFVISHSKLFDDDVIEIRKRNDVDSSVLAETFGVSIRTINSIRSRQTWKHI